ncbi:hypothetical protein N7508_009250 [Penicillium antarcticum]|uniref:uncharacterized protein n=1 Tax=Penicillium antarcticum TaxID=416450 RepID=UPI0023A07803|nr:uncharacterized protein N7508_009250 [Penicillium antarcticum]KAJ5294429.1 hypothetical protein N7508_009250 [Penicillium antarcticum]
MCNSHADPSLQIPLEKPAYLKKAVASQFNEAQTHIGVDFQGALIHRFQNGTSTICHIDLFVCQLGILALVPALVHPETGKTRHSREIYLDNHILPLRILDDILVRRGRFRGHIDRRDFDVIIKGDQITWDGFRWLEDWSNGRKLGCGSQGLLPFRRHLRVGITVRFETDQCFLRLGLNGRWDIHIRNVDRGLNLLLER